MMGILRILVSVLLFIPFFSYALTPTAAQIEAFKNLSPADQQRLAKQYGVSLPSTGGATVKPVTSPEVVMPRSEAEDTAIQQGAAEATDKVTLKEDQKELSTHQKLKQFGYDLFAGTPTTFAPATDIPVPVDYIVGPGDTVMVQLYGKENAAYELIVNREGVIQFPEIGPLTVAGQAYQEMKQYLKNTVDKQMIGVKASITMGALRSIRVFVLGEAHRPGSYTVSSLSTMTNALFVSGGITKLGSLRNIQLKRKGQIISSLDLYDLLLNGDTSNDQRLLPGDVLFIPPIGKTVGIAGEVRRPAIYELKSESNLQQLVKLSGGYLPTAYPQASRIERINAQGYRTLLDVDLSTPKGKSLTVQDGDVVQVFPVLEKMEKVVVVKGHLHRPGGFAWKPGLRVSDVITSEYDLLPNPDLNYALIIRENQPTREIDVISFNLGEAIKSPRTNKDLKLKNRDEILVFSLLKNDRQTLLKPHLEKLELQASSIESLRVADISGNVRFPGSYPLTNNMTAKQLIEAAGGFHESAFDLKAEITRAILTDDMHQEYERIVLDLGKSENVKLESRDQLFIKKIPNWSEKETASISGEVNFPGEYPIFKGDTIADLVARAGGLTEFGDPNASIFMREDLKRREQQQLLKYQAQLEKDLAQMKLDSAQASAVGAAKVPDASAVGDGILQRLVQVQAQGRLVVELGEILAGESDQRIELKDKDQLVIPRKASEVSVVGEVQFPTAHLYEEGLNVFDYVNVSGGLTAKSDDDRIYVIKPNGKIVSVKNGWFIKRNADVGPGDTVVVPFDTYSTSPMVYWTSVSQILFQLATTAAALNSVGAF